MAIYEMTDGGLRKIEETSFGAAKVRERADLQRLLRDQIGVVAPDVLVIAEEFGEWEDSKRRIDLLGLDKEGNLVVIELKRTEDGGHMELQAIRYAAMVSAMTFDKAVELYGDHLRRLGRESDARTAILEFLNWEEAEEERFAQEVRILLVSAEFSKELTTAVMWMNEHGLDITCVRMKPYQDSGRLLIDVQQVIPLPEAADYIVNIKEKEGRERSARKQQSELNEIFYRFWAKLLERARRSTELHANISPARQSWLGASSGHSGLSFNYAFGHDYPRVELYFSRASKAENKAAFDQLQAEKAGIEQRFGGVLEWERLDENKSCRIKAELPAGSVREEAKWPELQDAMIDKMVRFENAIRPELDRIRF